MRIADGDHDLRRPWARRMFLPALEGLKEPLSSNNHISWIPASALTQSWLPAYFEPRYMDLERVLAADPRRFVRLGEVVTAASLWPSGEVVVEWHVVRRGDALVIERASEASNKFVQLPDECVVLHPLVFQGQIASALWSSRLVGGDGATSSRCYALVSRDGQDVAWLEEALAADVVATQLERASVGGLVPLLRHSDLLDVRIPNLDYEERLAAGQRARARLVRTHTAPVPKHHVLTGASHEERLDQFERILFDEAYALPGTSFFIQHVGGASNDSNWLIRPLGQSTKEQEPTVLPTPDDSAVSWWRAWYWQEPASSEPVILNSLDGDAVFPQELLVRLLGHLAAEPWHRSSRIRLPLFPDFRSAVESARDEDLDLDLANAEVARVWESANPGAPLFEDIFNWLRQVFRPILAVRVARAGKAAGAYLLFGPDQLERPIEVASHMELQGQRLAAMLEQPSEIAEDAARRESLRRLSWMMHQLNGPMAQMKAVIEELQGFVQRRSDIAAELLPDAEKAERRATMTDRPLEVYRLDHRLGELAAAAEGIRQLQYQIRRYKNAHGELQLEDFPIVTIFRRLEDDVHGRLREAAVQLDAEKDLVVTADRGLVYAALGEVVSNACRECIERHLKKPQIVMSASRRGNRIRIGIADNGLPADSSLPADPFAEDASTYRLKGKGSGLGLAIVRETFARHGGRCTLQHNANADGERLPGVHFTTDLAAGLNSEPESTDV